MNAISPDRSAVLAPNSSFHPRRDIVEVCLLVALSVGGVVVAQRLGPTRSGGNLVALAAVPLALALALLAPRFRGESLRVIGFKRPPSWPKAIGMALVLTPPIVAASWAVESGILPRLLNAAPPDTSHFDFVQGNLGVLLGTLAVVWFSAALSEEIIFRGFLMTRLARIFGGGQGAWIASLLLSSIDFGALHLYQGLSGVLLTGFVGLLLGLVFLASGRNLWVAILVHGLTNSVALFLLYLGIG